MWTLREHIDAFNDLNVWKNESLRSLSFRYGGISVGGRLPVLDVDPKSIQNAVAQIGRLLNVTGVNVSYYIHCEFDVIMFHIYIFFKKATQKAK